MLTPNRKLSRFITHNAGDATYDEWVVLDLDKVQRFKERVVLGTAKTETDARARLLVYLIENKLVTV
jgi:hypothetical protein